MKQGPLKNIWFINLGVLFVAIILIAKLGYVQIAQGEVWSNRAEQQYSLPTDNAFIRGTIFFQEKSGRKVSAAITAPDYILAFNPTLVRNPEVVAEGLLSIVTFDAEDFISRVHAKTGVYRQLAKNLTEEQVAAVRALGEPGIIIRKDKRRYYPIERTASQVIGFVGSNGDTVTGLYGLERYYNELLERNSQDSSSGFFVDLFLKPGKALLSSREREGDIVTTIEPSVQGMLERILQQDILDKYDANLAMGIIMDPYTGEIYAMGSAPTFDLNAFSRERNVSVFSNPLVQGTYEMGSIVKPLTLAAGIDAGVITAETTYEDTGFRIFNTRRISNYDGRARGVVSMQEVLSQSLNTGTAFIMERIGKDSFKKYFTAFGLGEETGIDLPNEAFGSLVNLNTTRDIEYVTASFGQGITTTPIAMIRALAALGNGGTLVTPHIVERIEYGFGRSQSFLPNTERRVIKKETSEEISRMLTEVVDKALLGGTVKLERYSIAAKTGTAQEVVDGVYSDTNYLHTFFGYFPSYNPRFIVFLAVQNPQGVEYASHTLTDPFMQITKFLINYYEIPPDR